ncbi:MAG: PAS domain-containing protein [Ginsengibacter sp.]
MINLISSNAEQIFDLQGALAYASAIINTVREPLVVLYPKQIINSVNESFYKTFKTDKQHTVGKHIYEIGNNQWNIPQLRTLLEDILAKESAFHDFEVEHHFETIGHKIMLLNARKLVVKNNDEELILLAIEDITGRRALEKKSAKEKHSLSEIKRLRELAKQKNDFFPLRPTS